MKLESTRILFRTQICDKSGSIVSNQVEPYLRVYIYTKLSAEVHNTVGLQTLSKTFYSIKGRLE